MRGGYARLNMRDSSESLVYKQAMPHAPALVGRSRLSGATLQFMQRMWDLVHALDVRSKRMAKTLGVTGPQRLVVRVLGQSPETCGFRKF
jgi:hypothetical protein